MTHVLGITILMFMSYVTCQPRHLEHPMFQDPANSPNQMFQVQPNTVITKPTSNPSINAAEQIQAFLRQQGGGGPANPVLHNQANIQAQRQVEQAQRFSMPPQLSGSPFPSPFGGQGQNSVLNLLSEGRSKQAELQSNSMRDQHELQREAAIKASEWQRKAIQEQRASQEKAIQAQRDFQKQALEAAANLQLQQQNRLREIQQRSGLGINKPGDTSINFDSPKPSLAGLNGLLQSLSQQLTPQSPRSTGLSQLPPNTGLHSGLGQISQIAGRPTDRGFNSLGQTAQNARGFSPLGQLPHSHLGQIAHNTGGFNPLAQPSLPMASPFTNEILQTAAAQQGSRQPIFQPHRGSFAMPFRQRSEVPPQIHQGLPRFATQQQGLALTSSLQQQQQQQGSNQGASQILSTLKRGLNQLTPGQELALSSLIDHGLSAFTKTNNPQQALVGRSQGNNRFADETIRQIELMNSNAQNLPLSFSPSLSSPMGSPPIVIDHGLQSLPSTDRSAFSSFRDTNPFSSHDTIITLPPEYSLHSFDQSFSYPRNVFGF